MSDPFTDLTAALGAEADVTDRQVRVDGGRRRRTGVPEIVLAQGKTDQQLLDAVRLLLREEPRVIVSRCDPGRLYDLEGELRSVEIDITEGGTTGVVVRDGALPARTGGRVGCLSAGSSDVATAMEAVVVAREMGCDVEAAWDVGVAGLHRLVGPLRRLVGWSPDVFVVAAGMDGVLPTVVSGLVDVPVIGLPVSTGYGHGGGGEGALTTMLQSCAPGVVVVNVDNGVGAGVAAAKIANRAASARRGGG